MVKVSKKLGNTFNHKVFEKERIKLCNMREVHPLIEAIATSFYGGRTLQEKVKEFLKDFKKITGYYIDIYSPDGGIYWFAEQKWKLPPDSLINFVSLIEVIKRKKHKNLKRNSEGILIGSVIIQALKLFKKEFNIKTTFQYTAKIKDAKQEALNFRSIFGLDEEILTFDKLTNFLESHSIPVFVLPLRKLKEEGICNPGEYAFVIINQLNPFPLASFLLAHEIGHLIFLWDTNETEEENFANRFGTYLIISEKAGENIKTIFDKIKRTSNKYFLFTREICLQFSCKIHPKTALAYLMYEGLLEYPLFRKFNSELQKLLNSFPNKNISTDWLKQLISIPSIRFPQFYVKALEELVKTEKISEQRKKELMLEEYLQWLKEQYAVIPP